MTASVAGRSVTFTTSRLVQYGVPSSPSIGGAPGSVPGVEDHRLSAPGSAGRRPRRPASPTSRPWPCTSCAPASSSRSTATVSSQSSVASSRIRFATGVQVADRRTLAGQAGHPARPRRARSPHGSSSCSARSRSTGTRRRPGASRSPRRRQPRLGELVGGRLAAGSESPTTTSTSRHAQSTWLMAPACQACSVPSVIRWPGRLVPHDVAEHAVDERR